MRPLLSNRIRMILFFYVALLSRFSQMVIQASEPLVQIQSGDHLCIMGSGLADRMQHDGWLETLLQNQFPKSNLTIRNIAYSGDEVVVRLQTDTGATREEWLNRLKVDVIFAFYGFNESFAGDAGIRKFREETTSLLQKLRSTNYNGRHPPRVVLFSPIAQEKLADPNLPDPSLNNNYLALYTKAMSEVAAANGVPFVDLYAMSQDLYRSATKPMTFNGIHLTAEGNRILATRLVQTLLQLKDEPSVNGLERLREAVIEKSDVWHSRYRTVDSYNIYQKRSLIGYQSGKGGPKVTNAEVLQPEMSGRDVMTRNRDHRIWAIVRGDDYEIDDSNVPPVPKVGTNLPGINPDGSHVYLSGEDAISKMTIPAGFKIELFASEEQFPALAKPVQMAWDTKGRLWIAAWPNYPSRTPDSKDGDKLLILEDADGDGKADKCTTFIDTLNCPTGFQFYKDGVLVMRSPDLLFLRDTDGDGKADWQERVLMGIDAADSHHETNSMVLDPGGAVYLSDGVFHRTQIETAMGVVRNSDGAIYRYEPLSQRFERYVAYPFANPHGRVFDSWGNDIITDGTMNHNYFAPAFSGHISYPRKHAKMKTFWSQPSRPCPGTAILSSRHFPEEYQGAFLNLNVIGMQGVFCVKVKEDGSGLLGETQPAILSSTDRNFRPVGASVAPDGSLYIIDWANAIIGHLQHHLRDPNRDHVHGRIYRMTYPSRPLLRPSSIDGQPIPVLLDNLKVPEDNQRMRAKLELSKHNPNAIVVGLKSWVAQLNPKDPGYDHQLLEALWVHQWNNIVDIPLLRRVLASPNYQARAAGARVLCYWRDRVPEVIDLFKTLADDEHPRVRLEAIRAASFFAGSDIPEANEIAYRTLTKPSDYYLDYCYQETIKQLRSLDRNPYLPTDSALSALVKNKEKGDKKSEKEEAKAGPTRALSKPDLRLYESGKEVFTRDAHCVTCHQADGKGLPGIYPPLTNRDWLSDEERIIKIVLKGLWGHSQVGDKTFDPNKGVPPMTGFAALLSDEEVAAVLTFVRQSFGNDLPPVKPAQVFKVRQQTKNKVGFYLVDELMKENPVPGWENWISP